MWLVSLVEQTASLLGQRLHFAADERIHTEHSHKYDVAGFHALGRRAGWRPLEVWMDAERLFSVHVLEAGDDWHWADFVRPSVPNCAKSCP